MERTLDLLAIRGWQVAMVAFAAGLISQEVPVMALGAVLALLVGPCLLLDLGGFAERATRRRERRFAGRETVMSVRLTGAALCVLGALSALNALAHLG